MLVRGMAFSAPMWSFVVAHQEEGLAFVSGLHPGNTLSRSDSRRVAFRYFTLPACIVEDEHRIEILALSRQHAPVVETAGLAL